MSAGAVIAAAVIGAGLIGPAAPAAWPEDAGAAFRQVRGGAIERLMSGTEFGDGVHWRYEFRSDHRLVSIAMGRKRDLVWSVRLNQLCWTAAAAAICHDVWRSGSALRLQPGDGTPALDGVIKRL